MSVASSASIDWRSLNLGAGGRSLIEASAGTGKTWTIAVLYLRLLLERGLSPRQIVVTTFTDAAAQELRERLRAKLEWAVRHAGVAEPADFAPPDEAWLHARWADDPARREQDLASLRLALAEMDIAPVNTLHGLCRRVLADYPFACGVTFVAGELVPADALLEEVVQDLWRGLQQGDGSDPLAALQADGAPGLSLQSLMTHLRLCLGPGVEIPLAPMPDLDTALPREWAARLRELVARDRCLDKRAVLRRAWLELADYIDTREVLPPQASIDSLQNALQLKGVLKCAMEDADVLAAAAFSAEVAPLLRELGDQLRLRFWHGASVFAREAMRARLQSRHQLTFDALLSGVGDALAREAATGARPLADALFAAWPVALVDEFQDTDAQQYGILDAIYRDDNGAPRGRLVMIGDPKQAIYRFRGGDIHAYRRAAQQADADGRMTLDTNYRSSRSLVAALNQFYQAGGLALSAIEPGDIQYKEVQASTRCDAQPYTIGGVPCTQPLALHYLADDVPAAAGERCTRALEVCANQIAALLASGAHHFGEDRVQPSDIAVLLPTGRNIADLRDLLARRGVPCVTSIRTSVLHTDIARELQVVLYAVAHQGDLGALRAAAATRLWGDSFDDLRQRAQDVTLWQGVTDVFRQWHVAWRERGIQSVVDALLAHMAPRYLRTLSGERALTDLRHLGELLQAQGETLDGTEALLAWFNAARTTQEGAGDAADAAQLRIESDAARVRLMTLHASKGLEFPIVFLPLMWNHGERRDAQLHVVNDTLTGRRSVAFSRAAREAECQDLQDERFRVLYVALTRAIHACHVFALPPERGAAKSRKAAAGTARSALDVMLERMQAPPLSPATANDTPSVAWVEGWQPRQRQDFRAAEEDAAPRHARALPSPSAEPVAARYSFTTLVRGGHEAIDPPASAGDEADAAVDVPIIEIAAPIPRTSEAPHPDLLALAGVRGTDIGNAVHAIFEHRQIGVTLSAQHALITHCLDDAGVRRRDIAQSDLVEALGERLQAALQAPLGLRDAPALALAQLAATALRAEMEFHFPLHGVAMAALREACVAHGEPDLVPASTRVLSGLMNGKIDLIFEHAGRFHVLDYKGNYLGDTLADYADAALRARMDENHYRFQALIYTVAADRYLRQRIGARYRREQLGQCVYLFVRAAGLATDTGIWRHRFADALLDAVDAVLTGDPTLELT
ncbi:MAG: UvrD-helicase domain-containing protein [Rhodanobacter sp.]